MSDFSIKTHLDLDDSEARSKIQNLSKEKVKVKADLEINKSRQSMQKSLNNELKGHKALIDKQLQLEDRYQNAKTEKARKGIQKLISENEKALKKSYSELSSKNDGKFISQLKDMDNALLGRRGAKDYLKSLKDVEKLSRKTIKDISNLENQNLRQSGQFASRKAQSVIDKIKSGKYTDENLSLAKREAQYWSNEAKEIARADKAVTSMNEAISKLKTEAGGIKNADAKSKALSFVSDLENQVKSIGSGNAKKVIENVNKVSKSFSDIGNNFKNIKIDDKSMGKAIKNVESHANRLQTSLNKAQLAGKASDLATRYGVEKGLNKVLDTNYDSNFNKYLSKNQRTLKNYDGIIQRLNQINRLEQKNSEFHQRSSAKLDYYKDSPTGLLANRVQKDLNTKISSTRGSSDINSTLRKMNEYKNQAFAINREIQQVAKTDNLVNRLDNMESFLKPRQLENYRKQVVDLMRTGEVGSRQFERGLKSINNQLSRRNYVESFKNDIKSSIIGTSAGYLLGTGIRRAASGGYAKFKELDASMTDIKKVADPIDVNSEAKIRRIGKVAIQTAKEVGMSSADVQSSIATAIQSGMGSMQASIAVARKSMILANVGDMDKSEATAAVNTIVKSFHLDPLKKATVNVRGMKKETTELGESLDILNHIGNNYAITSGGLADALRRGGGVLNAYGVNLKDSAALMTAANEAIQNPEQVGNGMKAIAINFAGMTASAKDGTIKLNKTATALKGIAGIDIYADKKKGQIKNMVTIMDELHGKWGTMRDDQRAALSEAIAGKHRANIFQALMGNYETFQKIRGEFEKGLHFGSAEKENEKYVNSFAGKSNRLKETLTSLMTTTLNTKLVYGALDGLNAFAEGIEKIVSLTDKAGIGIPSLVAGAMAVKSVFSSTKSAAKSWDELINGGSTETRTKRTPNLVERLLAKKDKIGSRENLRVTDSETDSIKKNTKANAENIAITDEKMNRKKKEKSSSSKIVTDGETEAIRKNTKAKKDNITETNKGLESSKKANAVDLVGGQGKAGKLGGLKDSLKGIGTSVGSMFLGTLAATGISFLISQVVGFGIKKYDELANSVANSKKKHMERAEVLGVENKAIKDNIGFVKSNTEAINKLYSTQSKLSKKNEKDMSVDELQQYQEAVALSSKIAEIMPSAVRYDSKGNPILAMSVSAETLEKRLNAAQKSKQRLLDAEENKVYNDNIKQMFQGEKIGSGQGGIIDKIKKEQKAISDAFKVGVDTKGGNHGGMMFEAQYKENTNMKNAYLALSKGGKDYAKNIKDYRTAINRAEKDAEAAFTKQNELIAQYDEVNAYNNEVANRRLGSDKRMANFGEDMQNSILDLGSNFTWGKIKNQRNSIDMLMNLGKNTNPKQISEWSEAISKLNEAYSMDKDYESYSNGIDKISSQIAKASGRSKNAINEMIKDVNRGYSSIEEKQEVEFLKRHGSKVSDQFDDDKARAARADKLLQTVRAYQDAEKILRNATNSTGIKAAFDEMSGMEALGKLGSVANALANSNGDMSKYQSDMLSLLTFQRDFSGNTKEAKTAMEALNNALRDGATESIKLGNGLELSSDFINHMRKNGIKSGEDIIDTKLTVNQEQFDYIADYYKNKKIEVPIEVQTKIANAELTTKELDALEKVASVVNPKNRNEFRGNAAKFFKDTGGDVEQGYKNMASSAEGLRTAIESGLTQSVAKYNKEATIMNDNLGKMSDKLRQNVNNLSPEKWAEFAKGFGSLNKEIQNIANNKGITDLGQLTNMQNVFNTGKASGLNDTQSRKVVEVGIRYFGIEQIGQLNGMLSSLPEEKRIKVMTSLMGENGEGIMQGMKLLNDYYGSDTVTRNLVFDAILQGDPNLLAAINEKNIGQVTAEVEAKIKKKDIRKEIEGGTKGAKVEMEIKPVIKGTNNPQGQLISTLQNSGLLLNPNKVFQPSQQPQKQQQPQGQNKQNNTITVDVKINGEDKIKNLKASLNSISTKAKTITITTNLRGAVVGMINSRANAIRNFPARNANSTLTSNLRGATANMIYSRANAVRSFPSGSKTYTITTVYKTIGSPSGGGGSSTHKNSSGKKSGGSSGSFGTSIFTPTLLTKPKRNTQMNPLVGTPVGVASPTSGDTVGGGFSLMHGGYATPTSSASEVVKAVENFEARTLKGFNYKQVSYVDKIVYSAKEMATAFQKNIDIFHEMDRAINRVANSISILELRIARLNGASKMAAISLAQDQLRESIRRNDAKGKAIDSYINYLSAEAKKKKIYYVDGVSTNYFANMSKWAAEEESIEKKLANAKGKTKDSLEKRKKEIEQEKKLISELDKFYDEKVSTYKAGLENKLKIEEFEDEKHKIKISAFTENFAAMSRIMEDSIKKISNSLSIIDVKLKYAYGADKLMLMNAQIQKHHEMNEALNRQQNMLENTKTNLQSRLVTYGFKFDGNSISNYQEQLAHLKDTSNIYDEIKGLANEWLDIVNDKLPNANKEIEEHNALIKDVEKQKLEYTKEVEDKIIALLKKQIDKRTKMLEEENNKQKELLRKRKEAYNDARKEVDYKDEYNERAKEIEKLERRKSILERSSNQKDQKELQRVLKELEQKRKDLQKYVQKHTDDNVNKTYDEYMNSLDDQVKNERENTEKKYTDNDLRKKAQEAISTGVLTGINGEVITLKDALVGYINEFEDGLSAAGGIVQAELISKLQIAYDTAKRIPEALSTIGIGEYGGGRYIQYDKYSEIENRNKGNTINNNAPYVVMNNPITYENMMAEMEVMIKKAIDQNNRIIKDNSF